MNKTSFETVEQSQINPKVNHKLKLTSEVESVILENNHLLLEGYCFVQKIDKSRIKKIQFLLVDTSQRNRDILILDNVKKVKRHDVTFIYGLEKNLNYDYSGFKIKIDLDRLSHIKGYKRYRIDVLIKVDNRNIILPLNRLHSTLEKNILPKSRNLRVEHKKNFFLILNENKRYSKEINDLKDKIYKKTKSTYKNMPMKVKKDSIKEFVVFCKKKFLN